MPTTSAHPAVTIRWALAARPAATMTSAALTANDLPRSKSVTKE